MGGSKDDELYVRFLQFGVFSPINRLHSTNSPTFTIQQDRHLLQPPGQRQLPAPLILVSGEEVGPPARRKPYPHPGKALRPAPLRHRGHQQLPAEEQ